MADETPEAGGADGEAPLAVSDSGHQPVTLPSQTVAAVQGEPSRSERNPVRDSVDEDKQRRERVSWVDSSERRKGLGWEIVSILCGLFLISYGTYRGDLLPKVSSSSPLNFLNSTQGQVIAGFIVYECGRRYRKTQRKIHNDRFWLADARQELDRAEAAVDQANGLRLPVLWDVTEKRLAYYHRIVTRQAEQSFRNGQVAMSAGFVVLILGASLALTADTTAKTVVAGTLSAIGAAIAAYIGRTFVRSQESASQHLLMYFRQPLELSRSLAAERLLSEMERATRSTAAQRLMESILSSGPEGSSSPQGPESVQTDTREPGRQPQS
ncbi:TRADD-N-associated membrane domain-containing protein [Streptomyces sp. NPDC005070]